MGFKVRIGPCPVRFCKKGHDTNITGRYNTNCKICSLERTNRSRKLNSEYIRIAKDKPCLDCGVKYPPYVMDFDHRPGEIKVFQVASGTGWAFEKVKNEIAKCDIVCANCHRIRTAQRRLSI